eukprot:scaffold188274_cov67-Cyclotella_meneghiniana.AAC.2
MGGLIPPSSVTSNVDHEGGFTSAVVTWNDSSTGLKLVAYGMGADLLGVRELSKSTKTPAFLFSSNQSS